MCTKRFVIALLAIGTGIGVYAQEIVTERLAGHELTETHHTEQRISLPVDPASADSLVEVWNIDVNTYIDTLRTITQRKDSAVQECDSVTRKGHYVEIHAGAGLGNVGYGFYTKPLIVPNGEGREHAALSTVVQLQYAYFFHKNVGIGVGAWLANYSSHSLLQGEWVFAGDGIIDTDGEIYEHHSKVNRWNERHTIHTVGVPITLQFQAWGKKDKAGFFMALGVAPAYTIKTNYHVLTGDIEHWGVVRKNAELHNMHEFGTKDYAGTIGKQHIKSFSATALIDLGLLVRMSPHTDLLLGLYGHYSLLDVQPSTSEMPRKDIGWYDPAFKHIQMEPYDGILPTKCLDNYGALHPWQAGVKIGVHWHSIDKPRTTTILTPDTTLQMVARLDTVWTSRIDTFQRQLPKIEQVQREIDRLNRIYFAFDSHLLTEDSKHFLEQIAEQLKTIPNKVIIGGHASKEGTQAHNARLAHYRALMVKYYLVDCGIPATRMIVKNYGTSVRNAINLHDDLSLDRRVEIIVQDE